MLSFYDKTFSRKMNVANWREKKSVLRYDVIGSNHKVFVSSGENIYRYSSRSIIWYRRSRRDNGCGEEVTVAVVQEVGKKRFKPREPV